ncbi:MAG: hypothetical protein QF619_14150 [Candidatus Binatia bacterium]|nr:hypothetical protein [Candidatus Binatia bacterium]
MAANEKKKLRIIYRSNSHSLLWILAEKAGIWKKNGLEVDSSPQTLREKAVESLKNGSIDVISGNHHNLYARRAKDGEDFVHLAQVGTRWTENRMVVKDSMAASAN